MLRNVYSSHYQEYDVTSTPFQVGIPNGLVPGKQIFISAVFLGDQAKIDLVTSSGNTALHINPRMKSNCVVRNTCTNGSWGGEEKNGPFPFARGNTFEVIILVEDDEYKVAINGAHAFEYKHRIPYQEVDGLNLYGDIQVNKVIFSGGAHSRVTQLIDPSIPFAVPIEGGPYVGKMIQIIGHIPPGAERFAINLQDGVQNYPDNIALHFNPRYFQDSVVLNNRQGGGWGGEELKSIPLQKGANFEILILFDSDEFKIAVNGAHFASFAHRNGLNDANHISIDGDIVVNVLRQY
jgi:galectin-9